MKISVILNAYNRIAFLKEQIAALQNQSVKPKNIFLWQNKHKNTNILFINYFYSDNLIFIDLLQYFNYGLSSTLLTRSSTLLSNIMLLEVCHILISVIIIYYINISNYFILNN